MSKVLVDVVSAEESLFSGEAEFVVAPSAMGEVGIYPNHAGHTSVKRLMRLFECHQNVYLSAA